VHFRIISLSEYDKQSLSLSLCEKMLKRKRKKGTDHRKKWNRYPKRGAWKYRWNCNLDHLFFRLWISLQVVAADAQTHKRPSKMQMDAHLCTHHVHAYTHLTQLHTRTWIWLSWKMQMDAHLCTHYVHTSHIFHNHTHTHEFDYLARNRIHELTYTFVWSLICFWSCFMYFCEICVCVRMV